VTPELIKPDAGRHSEWLESHREWGPGLHEDGFGIGPQDDVDSAAGFAAWVEGLRSRPARLWWIVEQQTVLGGIVLRPFTNDDVLRRGHIGYGVRPSARGRGLATWALDQVLQRAAEAEMKRVLLVCLDSNAASIKTIERSGGILDRTVEEGHGLVRHYWIDL
jgi:predicted acetyltransferase